MSVASILIPTITILVYGHRKLNQKMRFGFLPQKMHGHMVIDHVKYVNHLEYSKK